VGQLVQDGFVSFHSSAYKLVYDDYGGWLLGRSIVTIRHTCTLEFESLCRSIYSWTVGLAH
jgi:hypothetical protein